MKNSGEKPQQYLDSLHVCVRKGIVYKMFYYPLSSKKGAQDGQKEGSAIKGIWVFSKNC